MMFERTLAVIATLVSMVVAAGLFVAIGYCVFTSQWLPAIFLLLARKDVIAYWDGLAERLRNHARGSSPLQS